MKDNVLTPAEWHVMACLWEQSPLTGREIVEKLTKTIGWSRSTILTILRRMEEKQLVTSEDTAGATMQQTEDFLHRVYHGSIGMMLSAFTKKQSLSQSEIDELYAILDKAKEDM